MDNSVAIENIEEMRRQEGIDDVELEQAIRGLEVGDTVKITLMSGTPAVSRETLPVRITRITGHALQGTLARKPAAAALARLVVGSPLAFTTAHIHSVLPRAVSQETDRSSRAERKPVPKQ